MDDSDKPFQFGTRKLRNPGDRFEITLPPAAIEDAGLEAGDELLVTIDPDAEGRSPIALVPWSEADIREAIGREE